MPSHYTFIFFICNLSLILCSSSIDENIASQNILNLTKEFKIAIQSKFVNFFETNFIQLSKNLTQNFAGNCLDKLRTASHSSIESSNFEWILQLYDSSGGVPNGIHSGTITSLGDFDQCLQIGDNYPKWRTQYCLVTFRVRRVQKYTLLKFNIEQRGVLTEWERNQIDQMLIGDNRAPIVIGLCLPASCQSAELDLIGHSISNLTQHFDTRVEYCQNATPDGWLWQLIRDLFPVIIVLSSLASIIALGTLVDFIATTQFGKDRARQFEHIIVKLIRCFSVIHNVNMLFEVGERNQTSLMTQNGEQCSKTNNGKTLINLDILDGIRVFAIVWVIVTHCTTFSQVPTLMKVSSLSHYSKDLIQIKENNWLISVYIQSTYYAVSIFFMISGILVMYKQKSNINCDVMQHFIRHLIIRFIRLSPTLLATMGIIYYLRYMGTGPMFQQELIKPFVEPCKTNFWYHFFMVQNFLPVNQRCGSHTWYVAADFQLNLIAFIVLHLIRCRSKWFIGLFTIFAIITISAFLPLLVVIFGIGKPPNYNAFIDPQYRFPDIDLRLFYYGTYMHSGTFFIGILLGYILSQKWDFNFLINKKFIRFTIYQISAFTMLIIPFVQQFFLYRNNNLDQSSPLFNIILSQIMSYLFNLALATFIFICALNPKLYISQILSAKFLRPLSRLVFSAYLTHQMLIWFTLHQYRSPLPVNPYSIISFTTMIFAMTGILSPILYIMIECPFIRISKLLFTSPKVEEFKLEEQFPMISNSILNVKRQTRSNIQNMVKQDHNQQSILIEHIATIESDRTISERPWLESNDVNGNVITH